MKKGHQFLKGLIDKYFSNVRSEVLACDPFPTTTRKGHKKTKLIQ